MKSLFFKIIYIYLEIIIFIKEETRTNITTKLKLNNITYLKLTNFRVPLISETNSNIIMLSKTEITEQISDLIKFSNIESPIICLSL